MKQLILLVFALLPMLCFGQFTRLDTSSQRVIEAYIAAEKANTRMVGLSIGIIKEGEIAYLNGFGYQDLANKTPATENTVYRLASVSKSVTGLMAMRLLEEGQLDLNKDIRDYVPEYPAKNEGTITSEHLLSNESGIIHYSGSGSYCSANYDKTARNQYILKYTSEYNPVASIDIFKNQPICFEPGLHYQYTTWGFCLMAAVLERAGSRSYEQILNDEIVCPLGLPTMQIELQNYRPYANETLGYQFDDDDSIETTPITYTDYIDVSYKTGGGGLISSVVDLTMLMQAVVNRDLIADSTVKLFGTQHRADDGDKTYYGYGTSTGSRNGDSLFWHSGSQAKTATIIYYSPENKNGVAIMCNTYGVSLFPLARLIYDYLPKSSIKGTTYTPPSQNLAKLHFTVKDTICEGEDYDGHTLSGTYTDVISHSLSCDSIRTLHLEVLPKTSPECNFLSLQTPNSKWTIYPNPGNDFLQLSGSQKDEVQLEVYNSTGQILLYETFIGSTYKLGLATLPKGIYILKLRTAKQQLTQTIQFIKE